MANIEAVKNVVTKNIDNFMKDLKEALLEGSIEDEFWYILKSYIKLNNMPQEERIDEAVRQIIQQTKYSKYFKGADKSKAIEEFENIFQKPFENKENSYKNIIINETENSLIMKVLDGKKSTKSGINNDKTRYLGDIDMFNEADELLTEDYLTKIKAMGGEEGVERALEYGKSLAQTIIENKMEYYNNVVEYLVGFYANIAIAKLEEEEKDEDLEVGYIKMLDKD